MFTVPQMDEIVWDKWMSDAILNSDENRISGAGYREPPVVSVLIVTWNRREDILETIRSIYEQAYRNFEIILVDNGSTDGTVEAVRQAYPEVRLVALDRNMGAAVRRNEIQDLRYRWLWV